MTSIYWHRQLLPPRVNDGQRRMWMWCIRQRFISVCALALIIEAFDELGLDQALWPFVIM